MEIEYLKELEITNQVGKIAPREPMTIEEIQELETKLNQSKEFPKAFREYLFLAGKWGGTGVVDEDFEGIREDCEESLTNCGYTMVRPYFVFDRLDSQYSIFFLDEDKQDPDIFILDAYAKKEENWPLYRDVKYTFSKMIDDAIYRKKNNISL